MSKDTEPTAETKAQPTIFERVAQVEEGYRAYLRRKHNRPPQNHPYVYASSYTKCIRQMYLDMTAAAMRPPFEDETLARFDRGDDRENDLVIKLMKIGREVEPQFKVVGGQERFEIKGRSGKVVLVGKVDARLQWDDSRQKIPTELKSWHPAISTQIRKFDDLYVRPWTRRGAYQLLAYLLGHGEPEGLLVLDRPGIPGFIPVRLEDHLEQAERFLRDAEEAVEHVEAELLPDFADDPSECKRCPFFVTACDPPFRSGAAGMTVITDEDVIETMDRYWELKNKLTDEETAELRRLEKWRQGSFRGMEHVILGPFVGTGHWQKRTEYKIPAAVKEEYKHENPQGAWLMDWARIDE